MPAPIDCTSLTATEHANSLNRQSITEAMKGQAAGARMQEHVAAALEAGVVPLPAYEAPDVLNARALGWLVHLHRKSTTEDDWSSSGIPHAWWDRYSSPPMLNYPRFDLHESSYAMALMADKTPAWREVYAETLDGLVERYTVGAITMLPFPFPVLLSFAGRTQTHWAAVDWLEMFGDDPHRDTYLPPWRGSIVPEKMWGQYNSPGWVANGTNPYPSKEERLANPWVESKDEFIQPCPIRAEAMAFFKGWLLLAMGIHERVSGGRKWEETWMMAGVNDQEFPWTCVLTAWHSRSDDASLLRARS